MNEIDFRDHRKKLLRMTQVERFFYKVSFIKKAEGCWEWPGSRIQSGYGSVRVVRPDGSATTVGAQRLMWEYTYGDIPEGLVVCHKCDNPPCVRPDHLFIGTYADNIQDAQRKGRLPYAKPRILKGIARGETQYCAKLTEGAVREICRRYAEGNCTQRQLADEYGVHFTTVHRVVTGQAWRHVASLKNEAA